MGRSSQCYKGCSNRFFLTSHVDFGFGVWSTSGGNFTGWTGYQTTGTAIPCHDMNCLKVQVHRQGAPRIDDIIDSIN